MVLSGVFDPSAFTVGPLNADQSVDVTYIGAAPQLGLKSVAITGVVAQYGVLSAEAVFGDLTASSLQYQWFRDGRPISRMTADKTLTLTQDDVGHDIAVEVWALRDGVVAPSVAASAGIVAEVNDSPAGVLSILGRLEPGLVLSVSSSVTDPDGIGTLSYQWLLDGHEVRGATAGSLRLTADMSGHAVSVRGAYVDNGGTAESVTSASVQIADGTDGLRGTVYQWKTHQLMPGVQVKAGGGALSTTDSSGVFDVKGLEPGAASLAAVRDASDLSGAVTSADALAVLRMAVGTNPNPVPVGYWPPPPPPSLSPYQFIAADVNADGKVTSADALAILQMAVRAKNAPAATWVFVDEKQDLWDEGAGTATLNRNAVAWNSALSGTPGPEQRLNLVAILRGDVDGSWTAAGAQTLDAADPNYFKLLGQQLQQPLDVWGG